MPVMDEFREEREAIKNGTLKEKLQYFFYYYQWPVIIGIIVAVFAGTVIYQIVTNKDPLLYISFINCSEWENKNDLPADFIGSIGMDPSKYTVSIDSNNMFDLNASDQNSYTTIQKLTTFIGAGAMDMLAGGGEEFVYYANTVLFLDLRTVMSEEQITKYEPYFYYVDMSIIKDENGNARTPDQIDRENLPDPRKPEDMETPVPIAIYIDNCSKISDRYLFNNAENGIALGICTNSSNVDIALQFMDYLFE